MDRVRDRDALATTASAAHTDGEPWQQPTGAHDAYPLGATVTHNGKTWQALTAFCVWEPDRIPRRLAQAVAIRARKP